MKQPFVMPTKKNKKVVELIEAYHAGTGKGVLRYTIIGKNSAYGGTDYRRIQESNDVKGQHNVFFTDADPHVARSILANLSREYRKRYVISSYNKP
ncbi:MAG: hypothetical protein F4W68_04110 [Cenarchaeum sp. SB0661_bin_35]|nr:hypothetical protein [Cenarchaeum sp. SB0661_bin_35]